MKPDNRPLKSRAPARVLRCRAAAIWGTVALIAGCPGPLSDPRLLDPPPDWSRAQLEELDLRDLMRMADRTQDAWGALAEHADGRLQNDAAIRHAERFLRIFEVVESRRPDPAWKAYARAMQKEAARIADENVAALEIERLLVDGIYRRCLGCHAKFEGPALPTADYERRYGKRPTPAAP